MVILCQCNQNVQELFHKKEHKNMAKYKAVGSSMHMISSHIKNTTTPIL